MSAKRKLDLDAQKLNVIQQAMGLGLFSKKEIMKQYYDFDNSEVDRILKEKKEEEATEGADQQADQSQAPPPAPQGQEPAENTPPTANESFEASVDKLKGLISISEEDSKVLDRIIKKQQRKADTSLNEQHI